MQNQDPKTQMANSIVKAIGYAENGGKPDANNLKAGKTGEMKSVFQYTPDTWKKDAQDYLGNANTPISPDIETYVMQKKVLKLMNEGKTVSQIASMHNAGVGEPDAYTGKFSNGQSSVGVNKKYGVKFDVPSYAKRVLTYSKQFYTGPKPTPTTTTQSTTPKEGLLATLMKQWGESKGGGLQQREL